MTARADEHCCSALTLTDRQAAAAYGFTCSDARRARVLLADRRMLDAVVADVGDVAA